MTNEQAYKILHPSTSKEAIVEIDYCNGFNREAGIKIVEEACLVACNALEKMAGIERTLERLDELKCKPMELVYDVPLIDSIIKTIKEEVM